MQDYVSVVDWQQVIALSIVVVTAGIFAWRRLRSRKSPLGRESRCGCTTPSGPAEKGSIVYHARKGQRPEVIVKMK